MVIFKVWLKWLKTLPPLNFPSSSRAKFSSMLTTDSNNCPKIFRTNGILLQHLILGKPKTLWIYCSRQNSITLTHGHMPIPNYPLKITHSKCTIKRVLTNSQSPNGLDNPTKWKDFPTWMHWLTHSRSRMINLNISGFSILGKIQLSHFPSLFLNGRPFFAQS